MWGIVRQKVARGIPAPIFEQSMQRMMPAFRDYSASSDEITRGLLDRYGPTRVVDTPITQTGFAGPCIGSTYRGLGAFMTFKSSMQATDHIINSTAKSEYVSAGLQGMGAANSNMKSGGWIPEGSHYRDGQKTIGSAKRGIGGMLLNTDKAPIGVSFMPTRIEAVIPSRAQFPRVGKTVTLGNKRHFGTVSESASQMQSSQTEEKLDGVDLSWVVLFGVDLSWVMLDGVGLSRLVFPLIILPLGIIHIWSRILYHITVKEVLKEVKHSMSRGCPLSVSVSVGWLGPVKVTRIMEAAPKDQK